jgi:1,4-dihydroxy-2-naphthoate octaprenyltransferase
MLRWLRWSLRLRRVEYRVAELPIFLIPVLLTAPDAAFFLSAPFWEGLLIFFFLFAFGDLLNCLADRDLDAIYKPHLTEAVRGLGVRGVLVQAVLSGLAALGLAAHLSWLLGQWQLLAGVAVGLVVAWAYSVEPVRLKGRGLWQLAFYWLGLFTGPMLFAAMLVQPWPEMLVALVCLFYGLMQTGVILVNTAEDLPEDRHMGVRTAVVALGLPRSMALAWALTEVGALGTLTACTALVLTRDRPIERLFALFPLAVASAGVGAALRRLRAGVRACGPDEAIAVVKRAARWVPVWITALAVCSLLAALGVFL